MEQYKLIHGDCIEEMKKLDANSIDSIVCDPPYELGFMNKSWDKSGIANNIEVWKQAYRVLKPGGHMLAFSGTRTYHRMVCAIEDAGFEIRDQLAWIYGSGFPKSQNVGKMIDKKAGAVRKVIGKKIAPNGQKYPEGYEKNSNLFSRASADLTEPSTMEAKKWNGWGTALKPAQEPIVLARKPLSENTVADNVIKYNTGAINIDECRVAYQGDYRSPAKKDGSLNSGGSFGCGDVEKFDDAAAEAKGRWPANIIHDGSEEVLHLFPDNVKGGTWAKTKGMRAFNNDGKDTEAIIIGTDNSVGSAARFFYCAKANKKDREDGNKHPTVKPTEVMRYLIRLITPKDGIVLDPFNGSGSTGKAAMLEGKNYIGIDLSDDYIKISEARIKSAKKQYDAEADKNKHFETFE
jgi:DNA modification methylase